METLELKNVLIQRIESINDISFLEAIKTILDAKTESKTLILTDELKKEIFNSKKEIEKGLFIEQRELDKEIKKWLKKE